MHYDTTSNNPRQTLVEHIKIMYNTLDSHNAGKGPKQERKLMMMAMKTLIGMTLLILILAFSMAFVVPAPVVTPDKLDMYQNVYAEEEYTDEDGEESAIIPKNGRLLASEVVVSDVGFSSDVKPLDLDMKTTGSKPIAENFTEEGYTDDTISVELKKIEAFDNLFYVAYVKIATPSQLRTGIAGTLKNNRTAYVTTLAKSYNAIVAMNADNYTSGDVKNGYIVRQTQLYRKSFSKGLDALFIDENGDFHIVKNGQKEQQAALKALKSDGHEVINSFTFGPALVIDGELCEIADSYQWDRNGSTPRSAIGQMGPLSYVMVQVGERNTDSEGVSQEKLAQFMHDLGCQQAYNMDGGNSSILVYNGEPFSLKKTERDLKDMIYFCSAITE